jgi:hypothetical protein
MSDRKCPRCDGDGTVTCPRCNGQGSVERDDYHGILSDIAGELVGDGTQESHEECPNCDGDGEITCSKCDGNGVVDDDCDDTVRRSYSPTNPLKLPNELLSITIPELIHGDLRRRPRPQSKLVPLINNTLFPTQLKI